MQINTIANIRDEIFFLSENKVKTSTVRYIKIDITQETTQFNTKDTILLIYHTSDGSSLSEQNVFLTKQALLDSL